MRRAVVTAVVIGGIIALSIREYRVYHPAASEEAYVGSRGATVWSSTAEIRVPVANLAYGQHVQVYQHYAREALVSTPSGVKGWISADALMDPEIWRDAELLEESTKGMPVQAAGLTRARVNLHTRPGIQTPVILQVPGETPLVVLRHAMAPRATERADADAAGGNMEEWTLVRAEVKNAGTVAGWAVNRLIGLHLPEPLGGYQASGGMKIVAWFEIDHAAGDGLKGGQPEYLVAGIRGTPVGCNFNLLRVYTWSASRSRYETAFMDSRVCGKSPIEVAPAKSPAGDAYFSFENAGLTGTEKRQYRMRLTTVRRIDVHSGKAKAVSKRLRAERVHS